MHKSSFRLGIRLVFAAIGLFGVVFAISGILFVLPAPAAGGTCGPGRASEAPIIAVVDPGSIGAGREPAATNASSHNQWLAFVGECQSSADGRLLAAIGIIVLSVGFALLGPKLILRTRGPKSSSP
jgi:hypothetical protein